MKFLKSSLLQTEEQLKDYQKIIHDQLGITLPLSYLKQGSIRVFTDKHNCIRGGYALIQEGPYRSISSIPSDKRPTDIDFSQILEVNALWLDRKINSGAVSCQFWLSFIKDTICSRNKKHLIYTYDLHNKKLQKLYSFSKPQVLFRGMTNILPGMNKAAEESIELASLRNIAFLPIVAFPNLLCKLCFNRKSYVREIPNMLLAKIIPGK